MNGPFEVRALGGTDRHGRTGALVPRPLVVAVVAEDGRPPRGADGEVVPVRVRWEVVEVEGGAGLELLPRGTRTLTTSSDERGRARADVRLGGRTGAASVLAGLPDHPGSVSAWFRVFSEGVASTLELEPTEPTPVTRAMRLVVHARDWRGEPVEDAELTALLGEPPPPAAVARPRRSDGTYRFALRQTVAGRMPLSVYDARTRRSVEGEVEFLAGPPRRLRLGLRDDPRAAPPYREAELDLEARDRFGNLVPGPDVEWWARGGRVRRADRREGASASARLAFGRRGRAEVTARVGGREARISLELPDVHLRPLDPRDYSFVGETFALALEVFPPTGKGTVLGAELTLTQPRNAELVSVESNAAAGIPELRRRVSRGRLRLSVDRMEIPFTPHDEPLLVAELTYRCTGEESACVAVEEAVLTVHTSPQHPVKLNPGAEKCWIQKFVDPKARLCVNFCLVRRPLGPTLEGLQRDAEGQVQRVQEILDENVVVCCPRIVVKACYRELDWATYEPILNSNPPGTGAVDLSVAPLPARPDPDATKDAWPVSGQAARLLAIAACRRDRCVTVVTVPPPLSFGGIEANAVTLSPNDFPGATTAVGAGPTIVMKQGLAVDKNVLAHELGHMLIDLARGTRSGNEHAEKSADDLMGPFSPHGRGLSKNECSRVFDNISRYGGNC